MPHLTAEALSSDPDGLAFLRGVLEGGRQRSECCAACRRPRAPEPDDAAMEPPAGTAAVHVEAWPVALEADRAPGGAA
jgi:hypothetical protein